jgi:hypothetical protein
LHESLTFILPIKGLKFVLLWNKLQRVLTPTFGFNICEFTSLA